MEYYIIFALSFAIMYTYRYGLEVARTVVEVLDIFDMKWHDSDEWNPYVYLMVTFTLSLFLAPLMMPIIFGERYEVVKIASSGILEDHYGLERQN